CTSPAPYRADYQLPRDQPAARAVPAERECGGRRPHVIRPELARCVSTRCRLRAQDFARHAARRPARGAADQVRPDCQPQDSESTWAHDQAVHRSDWRGAEGACGIRTRCRRDGRRYLRAAIPPAIAPVIVALAAERDAYRDALLRTQAELFELLAEV